jgi:hypothetical protein
MTADERLARIQQMESDLCGTGIRRGCIDPVVATNQFSHPWIPSTSRYPLDGARRWPQNMFEESPLLRFRFRRGKRIAFPDHHEMGGIRLFDLRCAAAREAQAVAAVLIDGE